MAEHARRTRAARTSAFSVAAVSRGLPDKIFVAVLGMVVVFAGLSTAGGTYAFWNDRAGADAGTLSSGTAALEARWVSARDEVEPRDLLPGEVARRSLAVENTGDVPLSLSATTSGGLPGLEISLEATGGGAPAMLEPRTAQELAVVFRATQELAPGSSGTLTIALDGRQVR